MAHANHTLIHALRETAQRLRDGAPYAWGHHGQCNCGNLAQVATSFSAEEIQAFALASAGEWTEIAENHCQITGAPVDLIVQKLMELGLTPTDIHHLEYLDDRAVLRHLPGGFRWLRRNSRKDAVDYFEAFADLLENKMLDAMVERNLADLNEKECAVEMA